MDANAWKVKGNEAFSSKDFATAVDAFSHAIELDPTNHVLYSNRSASHASLKNFDEALSDAEKCVSLAPQWAKGYVRLGAAHHGCEDYSAAIEAYKKGLAIEPDNSALVSGLESAQRDEKAASAAAPKANPFAKVFGPDTIARIQRSPKLSHFLQDPDYVQKINLLVSQPNLASGFMQDQRIMTTMFELMGIDLSAMQGAARPSAPNSDASKAQSEAPKPAAASAGSAPKPAAPPAAAAPADSAATEAQKLKEQGNAFYQSRQFDEARAKYEAAFALQPANSTFLLNVTAVTFEQGNYDACLTECDRVITHLAEHNPKDFGTLAKALTRKGSCFQKLKRYEEAITAFKKALVENRNPDTLKKLDACEREKKQFDIEAYLSPELSQKAKDEGNAFFKADKFPEAVKAYEEAIKRNPSDHTLYSNRAAALLKLGAYDDAIKDCDKCLEINPTFVKAFARKGAAYFFTKQYHKALKAYEDGKKLEPTHEECNQGYERTLMKIQEQATSDEVDEGASRRAMADPEIQQIMGDSYMRLVLDEMSKDPKKIQDYLRNPDIAEKINKLIQAGVLRFGSGKPGEAGQRSAKR